jgi:ABC-type bacteriocin/lantibiotic exporter with double-glycine peptidase domain
MAWSGIVAALVLLATPALDVPYVPQEKDTCGPASLAMVLAFWGRPGLHDELAAELKAAELRGVAGSRLRAAAESRGMRAIAFKGDPAHLRRMVAQGRPVIVAWDMGKKTMHNVVVVGADDQGFVVHDPAFGASRHVDHDLFTGRWSAAGHWSLLVVPQ